MRSNAKQIIGRSSTVERRFLMPNSHRPTDTTRTVLSAQCLARRCELDDCSERVQTSSFLSATILSWSGIEFTSPERTRHRQDSSVVSGGVAVWISCNALENDIRQPLRASWLKVSYVWPGIRTGRTASSRRRRGGAMALIANGRCVLRRTAYQVNGHLPSHRTSSPPRKLPSRIRLPLASSFGVEYSVL